MTRREKGTGTYSYRAAEGRWRGEIRRRGRRYFVHVRGPRDGKTEARIKTALKELARDLQEGRAVDGRQTVGQYLRWWIDEVKAPNRQASTVQGYRVYLERHLIPELGQIPLRELAPQDVQSALNAMARKKRRVGGATLSPRSVQQARAILRAALAQAVSYELVARNAAAPVSIAGARRPETRALTPDEAGSFLEAIRGDRLEALYTVAVAVGLRQGEALGLRWGDVDLSARKLTVRQKLGRIGGQPSFGPPKTERSRRTLLLPEIAVGALTEHRKRQLEERMQAGKHWQKLDLVYADPRGGPLIGSTITHQFQRLLRAHGLPEIRFHDLRHSCASLLLAQGATLKDVMEILGHSQISLTANLYGHLYDDRRAELAAKMDRALGRALNS